MFVIKVKEGIPFFRFLLLLAFYLSLSLFLISLTCQCKTDVINCKKIYNVDMSMIPISDVPHSEPIVPPTLP